MFLVFLFILVKTQINLQTGGSLGITIICNTPSCGTLLPNYNGITPTLIPAPPIYAPVEAWGLVSANPLTITDYFSGVFTIINCTNGKDGKDGKDENNSN